MNRKKFITGLVALGATPAAVGSLLNVLPAHAADARNGTASEVAHRLVAANGQSLLDSPLSLLVLGGTALVIFALIRPWGGLKRVFGLYPAVRAALVGGGAAALLAGVLDGTALEVAGAATALGIPLAALGALRVLDHADDRTVAAALHPSDAWPDAGCPTGTPFAGSAVAPAGAASPAGTVPPAAAEPPPSPDRPALPGGAAHVEAGVLPADPAHSPGAAHTPPRPPAPAAGDVLL